MRIQLLILLFISISSCSPNRQTSGPNRQFAEEIDFPDKIQNIQIDKGLGVYDFEDFYTRDEEVQLANIIDNYFNKSNKSVAIVTFDSIAPYNDIINLITDLGNSIEMSDEGLIIAISKFDKKVAVVPTLISEEQLNQAVTDKAVNEILIPNFKEGEFYFGTQTALDYLIEQWQ